MGEELQYEKIHVDHTPYTANGPCLMYGSCPTLYKTERGSVLIIGHWLPKEEKKGLPISEVEDVIEIPQESMIAFAKKILGIEA